MRREGQSVLMMNEQGAGLADVDGVGLVLAPDKGLSFAKGEAARPGEGLCSPTGRIQSVAP
jgi:hypothetical protein